MFRSNSIDLNCWRKLNSKSKRFSWAFDNNCEQKVLAFIEKQWCKISNHGNILFEEYYGKKKFPVDDFILTRDLPTQSKIEVPIQFKN